MWTKLTLPKLGKIFIVELADNVLFGVKHFTDQLADFVCLLACERFTRSLQWNFRTIAARVSQKSKRQWVGVLWQTSLTAIGFGFNDEFQVAPWIDVLGSTPFVRLAQAATETDKENALWECIIFYTICLWPFNVVLTADLCLTLINITLFLNSRSALLPSISAAETSKLLWLSTLTTSFVVVFCITKKPLLRNSFGSFLCFSLFLWSSQAISSLTLSVPQFSVILTVNLSALFWLILWKPNWTGVCAFANRVG